ncbi:rolling circle replication-associated protein [Enterococcus termitis]|uniref:Replication-associated protein ORF2/G2P domain-containing protein n=1 Tax=Enterococcus termitis TaxID=332950 RepID=A0A1E5GTZ0_9ENTE|nr:hypothetical protein [Enterococcus termitis]OEG16156.1 hypothetical protein BCR25_18345 [Enterococcus termitis]
MSRSFVRAKRIETGPYVEVDIYNYTEEAATIVKNKRPNKRGVSRPKQRNLNDKNSRRHLRWLCQGNFGEGDYWATYTYKPKYHPLTIEDAYDDFDKFIARINYYRKKIGLEKMKYIYILEFTEDQETGELKHIHFHALFEKGVTMDKLDDLWATGRGKKRESLGRTYHSVVRATSDGIVGLAKYISKARSWKSKKKSWRASKNLKRPYRTKNDNLYTMRKIEKYATSNDYGYEYFEKIYPKYHITFIEPTYYEETGWHFHLIMWKKEPPNRKSKRRE